MRWSLMNKTPERVAQASEQGKLKHQHRCDHEESSRGSVLLSYPKPSKWLCEAHNLLRTAVCLSSAGRQARVQGFHPEDSGLWPSSEHALLPKSKE